MKTTPQRDGTALYFTEEGDMVDRVCWRFYGRSAEMTEQVLDRNPGLAGRGPVLPAGVPIRLPPPPAPTPHRTPQVRLWD